MNLRPYQRNTIDAVRTAWRKGDRDVLVMMATGGGKTVVFLALIDEILQEQPAARILVVAHRKELIEQPAERLREFYPQRAAQVGIVMADMNECDRQITIATVQTLQVERRLAELISYGPIDYLIVDECFPAGTMIDGRPIETIKVGDTVTAWNEETKTFVKSKVTRLFRNPAPDSMVRLIADGVEIICTPNHPILCNGKWTPAKFAQSGDSMVQCTISNQFHTEEKENDKHQSENVRSLRENISAEKLEFDNDPYLFGRVQGSSTGRTAQGDNFALRGMREKSRMQGAAWSGNGKARSGLLLGRMPGSAQDTDILGNDGAYKSEICQPAHEGKQSDGRSCSQRENANINEGYRIQGGARGEWKSNPTTGIVGECSGMEYGSGHPDSATEEKQGVSNLLQGGHRKRNPKSGYRGGWQGAQIAGQNSRRQEENGASRIVRVDSVEILERRSDERFDRLCPDGFVYNLEVETYHTYTANGFIVHNCHHAAADGYLSIINTLRDTNPNLKHLGVTATPVRSDDGGLPYDVEAAHLGIKELVRDGYLAPPRWLAIQTGISLASVPVYGSGGSRDFSQKGLVDVFETDNCFDLVAESHHKYAAGRKAIAFVSSVAGGYRLAEILTGAGIPAIAADGTTKKDERKAILSDFRAGRYDVLVNCALFTEGLDVPEVSCIHQVRPTKSDSLYLQMIGRALRTFPGKSDALILDYAPLDARNITMLGDVLGVDAKKEAYVEESEEEGFVIAGFTFDGDVKWLSGNPMEIVSRQLDYLNMSPWVWSKPAGNGGPMVLGLGLGEDGIQRSLVISEPGPIMNVWLVAKREEERWSKAYLVQTGTFEECSLWAEDYAEQRGNAVLARKARKWRATLPSDGQVKFARNLGVWKPGMNRGDCADAITAKLAIDAVKREWRKAV